MATCYHCAAHIAPGEGYRRQVTTSRQSRTWVSSRPGGSYGVTSGLRTLCAACALQLDQREEGGTFRWLVFIIGWFISALLAVRWGNRNEIGGLMMLFLLFGGPAWMVLGLLNWMHSADIAARNRTNQAGDDSSEGPSGSREAGEASSLYSVEDGTSEAALLVEPYPGVGVTARYLARKFDALGIAWLPCCGYENSLDGYRRLVREWTRRYPVDDFAGLQEWGEYVYGLSLDRFSEQAQRYASKVQHLLDAEPMDDQACLRALEPLLEIFPLKPEEELGEHWRRLHEVLAQLEGQDPDEGAAVSKAPAS